MSDDHHQQQQKANIFRNIVCSWRSSANEIDGRTEDLQSLSCIWRWPILCALQKRLIGCLQRVIKTVMNGTKMVTHLTIVSHSVSKRTNARRYNVWLDSGRPAVAWLGNQIFIFHYAFISIVCFSFAFRCFVNWRIQLTYSGWPPLLDSPTPPSTLCA